MMPEISIIVPVYKAEKYLRRCIDSILAQTFTDFELILIDDGSPDNCPAICDEYAQNDNRIRVIHKENGGVSSARNIGLDTGRGKYVMFCDADDYVDKDWCILLYRSIILNPNACIVSNIVRVSSEGETFKKAPDPFPQSSITYYEMFSMGLSGPTCNKIYNRKFLKEQRIKFDINLYIAEDIDFNIRYYQNCNAIIYISKPLYFYRDTPQSALNSYHPDWLRLHLFPFYIRIPYIEEKYIGEYCDGWLYLFINAFQVVFNKQNKQSFFSKLHYNQRMLNSEEFRFCLAHATGSKENPVAMKLLRMHNYYLYWLFQKAVQIKTKIFPK